MKKKLGNLRRKIYRKYVVPFFNLEEKVIEKEFRQKLGYDINFSKKPESFNQKIQFRKLYDKNPLFIKCADKYKVREYVKEKIGEEHLIPLYLVTSKLKKEHFDNLPSQFIIKNNNASGDEFYKIVRNKSELDLDRTIKRFNKNTKKKFGFKTFEYFYNEMKPLILVEKLLLNDKGEIPSDYKIHYFNGEDPFYYIQVDSDRQTGHKKNLYDKNWNLLPFEHNFPRPNKVDEKPDKLEEMVSLAKKLGEDFKYVRVDFYYVNNKVYFGELTFTPSSGFGKFEPREWDFKLGEKWEEDFTKYLENR